jgi:hypothetical protein
MFWVRGYWWCDMIARNTQAVVSGQGQIGYLKTSVLLAAGWAYTSYSTVVATTEEGPSFLGFYVHGTPTDFGIYVPCWALVAVTAIGSTSAWLPWRFSLRILLIAMTVLAVALGLIVAST